MARTRGTVTLDGFNRLIKNLATRLETATEVSEAELAVGFAAPYAVFVHENLVAFHPNGEAKFLERVIREEGRELSEWYGERLAKGDRPRKAMYYLGDRILRKAQKRTPVRTGFLKGSGFVKVI